MARTRLWSTKSLGKAYPIGFSDHYRARVSMNRAVPSNFDSNADSDPDTDGQEIFDRRSYVAEHTLDLGIEKPFHTISHQKRRPVPQTDAQLMAPWPTARAADQYCRRETPCQRPLRLFSTASRPPKCATRLAKTSTMVFSTQPPQDERIAVQVKNAAWSAW